MTPDGYSIFRSALRAACVIVAAVIARPADAGDRIWPQDQAAVEAALAQLGASPTASDVGRVAELLRHDHDQPVRVLTLAARLRPAIAEPLREWLGTAAAGAEGGILWLLAGTEPPRARTILERIAAARRDSLEMTLRHGLAEGWSWDGGDELAAALRKLPLVAAEEDVRVGVAVAVFLLRPPLLRAEHRAVFAALDAMFPPTTAAAHRFIREMAHYSHGAEQLEGASWLRDSTHMVALGDVLAWLRSADAGLVRCGLGLLRPEHNTSPDVIDAVSALLRSDDSTARLFAAMAVTDAKLDGGVLKEGLVALASDRSPPCRAQALEALRAWSCADPKIKALMLDRAISDPEAGVRYEAMEAVAAKCMDAVASRGVLERGLDDPDENVASAAISGLLVKVPGHAAAVRRVLVGMEKRVGEWRFVLVAASSDPATRDRIREATALTALELLRTDPGVSRITVLHALDALKWRSEKLRTTFASELQSSSSDVQRMARRVVGDGDR